AAAILGIAANAGATAPCCRRKQRIAARAGACAGGCRTAIAEDGGCRGDDRRGCWRCGHGCRWRGRWRWRGWRDRRGGKRRRRRSHRYGGWWRIVARRCRELAGLAGRSRLRGLGNTGAIAKLLPGEAAAILARL